MWVLHTLDTIVLLDILGPFNGFLVAVVPDGDIGAGLSKSLSYSEANTGSGTRDNCGLSLVGEERHNLVLGGSNGVVMGKIALGHSTVRHDEGSVNKVLEWVMIESSNIDLALNWQYLRVVIDRSKRIKKLVGSSKRGERDEGQIQLYKSTPPKKQFQATDPRTVEKESGALPKD